VIIIARAQSKKGRDVQAKDYFMWHMQGEALGYFLGPFIVAITFNQRG